MNIEELNYSVSDGQTAEPAHLNNVIQKTNEIVRALNALPAEGGGSSDPSDEPTVSCLAGVVIDPAQSLQEQFESSAIYYIRDALTLSGTTDENPLVVPVGSVLVFEQGSFEQGYIDIDGVTIQAPPVRIFKASASAATRTNIIGRPAATYPCAEWFGAAGNGTTVDNNALQLTLQVFGRCFLLNRSYAITTTLQLPENSMLVGTGIENTKFIYTTDRASGTSLIHARVGSSMRDLSIIVTTPSNVANLFSGRVLDIYPDTDALRDVDHVKPRYIFQRLSIRMSTYPGSKANMKSTGVRLADINRKGVYHALIEDVDVEFCKIAFELYAANKGGTEGVSYVNTNRIDRCRSFDCATTFKMSSIDSCEIRGNEIDITTQNLQEKDDTSPIYDIPTDFLCANNNIRGYLWDIKTGKSDGPAGYGMYGGFVGNIGSNTAQHTNRIIYNNYDPETDVAPYVFVGVLHWGSDPNTQFARLRCSMINKAPVELHLIVDIDSKTGTQKPTIWQLVSIGTNWVGSVHYVKHGNDYYIFLHDIKQAGYLHVAILESLAYYPPAFVSNGTTLPAGDASGEFALGSVKQL